MGAELCVASTRRRPAAAWWTIAARKSSLTRWACCWPAISHQGQECPVRGRCEIDRDLHHRSGVEGERRQGRLLEDRHSYIKRRTAELPRPRVWKRAGITSLIRHLAAATTTGPRRDRGAGDAGPRGRQEAVRLEATLPKSGRRPPWARLPRRCEVQCRRRDHQGYEDLKAKAADPGQAIASIVTVTACALR